MLIAVELMGDISLGAQRWLQLGPIRMQPSEIMKIGVVLALARFYHGLSGDSARLSWRLLIPAALIAVPVALVAHQPDLGTSLLILFTGVAMMVLAGLAWLATPAIGWAEWQARPFIGVTFGGDNTFLALDQIAGERKLALGAGVTWLGNCLGVEGEVVEVEPEDLLARVRIAHAGGVLVAPDQDQQREQPRLVPARPEQRPDRAEREVLVLAREPAQDGRAEAEEAVALGVLAGAGLEVARHERGVRGVGERAQLRFDRARAHRWAGRHLAQAIGVAPAA